MYNQNANTAYEENRNTCKRIVEEIELYTDGNGYKCPSCGEVHSFEEYAQTEHQDASGTVCYTCPNCSEDIEENELEAVSVYDYFEQELFDIEYRIDGSREYRSVCAMIACGGPNIYIDTAAKAVVLRWWGEGAEYPLSCDAVEAINQYFEECFNI